jgi:hypothetical protein
MKNLISPIAIASLALVMTGCHHHHPRFAKVFVGKDHHVYCHHRHENQDWYYEYNVANSSYTWDAGGSGSASSSTPARFSLPSQGTWTRVSGPAPPVEEEEAEEVVMEGETPTSQVVSEAQAESEAGSSNPSDGESEGSGDSGSSGDGGSGGGDGGGGDGGGGGGGD